MPLSPEQQAKATLKAKEKRAANKAEQEASTIHLEGGAKVYRDSYPGIGFVLEFPILRKSIKGAPRKCYYSTPEQAVEMWTNKWRSGFGQDAVLAA